MKKYIVLVLIALVIGALFVGVLAAPGGKSNVAHLYLYEKTGEPDWEIVDKGAWGKMQYNLSGVEFEFVFNGHGLEADTEYSLIYYPDPWSAKKLCLGTATADEFGDVHIMGSVDTGDLPMSGDLNANEDTTTYDDGSTGAKIWLVLSDDVNSIMTGWNPTEYLFEEDLITFDDTDVE